MKAGRVGVVPAQTMLDLLRRSLVEARDGGGAVLKLEPGDLRDLGLRAGVEGDAIEAFRLLVRSNLVRLRGRWREGASGRTSPAYVSRVVESGDTSRNIELEEGEPRGTVLSTEGRGAG